jgi:hypothetical protein
MNQNLERQHCATLFYEQETFNYDYTKMEYNRNYLRRVEKLNQYNKHEETNKHYTYFHGLYEGYDSATENDITTNI